MSAITVIYNLNKRPVEISEMEQSLDKLTHRGSNDKGIWISDNVGLGHRMRWVTPESLQEKLPMVNSERSAVITCDARIDNREELISQLSFLNKPKDKITDSEIILEAYQKWGENCPQKIYGDYVFAIWDKIQQKLFCARDPLGVKHFYYYFEPNRIFALASEIKALLCLEEIPKILNEDLVSDLLMLNSGEKVDTFYKNIKRLPSTHAMIIKEDSMRVYCYWQPDNVAEIKLNSDKEYEEAFREIFTEAVNCRLRSISPIGSSLSGGLDSSSVVCTASKLLKDTDKDPLNTFSMVFPDIANLSAVIDERQYMKSVIDQSGCTPTFVEADNFSPMVEIDKWFWHSDHPIGTPNLYMEWSIFKAAKNKGIKTVLSGTDGDTTISYGYEDFYEFAKRGQWLRMYREAKALNKHFPKRAHNLKSSLWKRGFKPVLDEVKDTTWNFFGGNSNNNVKKYKPTIKYPTPLNPKFAKRINLQNRFDKIYESNYPVAYNRIDDHWRAVTNGGLAFILEIFEKLAAGFEIEPRYPFFDWRLIKFCIALPPGQKLNNGWTRSILRRSMAGVLPPDVQWRKDKANLSANYKAGMLKYERTKLEDAIFINSDLLEEYLDMNAVRKAFQRYEANPMIKGESETMTIIVAVHLSNWLRQAGFA